MNSDKRFKLYVLMYAWGFFNLLLGMCVGKYTGVKEASQKIASTMTLMQPAINSEVVAKLIDHRSKE